MQVNLELIKKIRQETGAGLSDIREALESCEGDYEKAKEFLRKRGLVKAEKRIGRSTMEGVIAHYVHSNNKIGVLVEINCETDFVARNQEFLDFGRNVAMQVCAMNPLYLSEDEVPEEVKLQIRSDLSSIPKLAANPEILEKEFQRKFTEYVEQSCLLRQRFFKDNSVTIEDLMKNLIAKLGESIKISRFVRFEVGS